LKSAQTVSRKVVVTTDPRPLFSAMIATKEGVDMHGNTIAIDSFDSTDPNYSTGGHYDIAKRKDGGNVTSNSGIENSFDVGDADIWGKVSVGSGSAVRIGPNGSIGSSQFHSTVGKGIQDGWVS